MGKIVLASDHGGFERKEELKMYLTEHGYDVQDVGTNSDAAVDFPVLVKRGVEMVRHYNTLGIFVCGSGIGVSMAANRYSGIRAALVHSVVYAQLSRQHNDANVLCLGGRFIDLELAIRIVDTFLQTPFLGGKYKNRMDMLEKL